MARAVDRLQRRIDNERARGARFRDNQKEAGKKQVNIWLTPEQLVAIAAIQRAHGGIARADAVGMAVLALAATIDHQD